MNPLCLLNAQSSLDRNLDFLRTYYKGNLMEKFHGLIECMINKNCDFSTDINFSPGKN